MKLVPMPLKIKAVLHNRAAAETVAVRLSDARPETICQEDIFFRCAGARLKLRILGSEHGELIRYERPDVAAARCSRYLIARTTDPQIVQQILTKNVRCNGSRQENANSLPYRQTRVHIDEVEGLGSFLELEVVLQPEQSDIEGKAVAERLMSEFGIDKQQLIPEAYIDLLSRQLRSTERPNIVSVSP